MLAWIFLILIGYALAPVAYAMLVTLFNPETDPNGGKLLFLTLALFVVAVPFIAMVVAVIGLHCNMRMGYVLMIVIGLLGALALVPIVATGLSASHPMRGGVWFWIGLTGLDVAAAILAGRGLWATRTPTAPPPYPMTAPPPYPMTAPPYPATMAPPPSYPGGYS